MRGLWKWSARRESNRNGGRMLLHRPPLSLPLKQPTVSVVMTV